jgi:hypothetical protein
VRGEAFMSNSTDEIKDIQKRLKAIENVLNELKERDLYIAEQIVSGAVKMELNIAARTMRGEEAKRFRKVFEQKDKATQAKLSEAKTVEQMFEVWIDFDHEIADYVRATKVDTADKAMEIAHSFIKKYVPVALPMKAEREGDVWLVDVDVGAFAAKIAKVKVDARTGDILSYEIPPK